ncbi:MAG TPA: amidohydrolase family protein [Verrucomicrobiae bacterium]|nr:amidohydrolase family protein [Verrucomicrobiae bacterium]
MEKRHASTPGRPQTSFPRSGDARQTAQGGRRDADESHSCRRLYAPLGFAVRVQTGTGEEREAHGKERCRDCAGTEQGRARRAARSRFGRNLETEFERREVNSDEAAMKALLTSPYTIIGQSDGGAHVVFRTDYSYATYLLSHWVRQKQIMSMEDAIRKLTFIPASLFGLYDRGLVRQGMAADLMIFDPESIAPLEPGEAYDLPGGSRRRKQLAKGIEMTVVNGQVLIEKGEHTGAHPGKVARSGRA